MDKLIMYIVLPISIMVSIWLFIIFTGEDMYRYPCQDPENWSEPHCYPPTCEADGTCLKYLITIPEEL